MNIRLRTIALTLLSSGSLCGLAHGASFAEATTAAGIDWNSTNAWLPKIATPVSADNDYTATDAGTASTTVFGVTWTGVLRVMAKNGDSGGGSYDGVSIGATNTFNGGSLTLIPNAQLLLKQLNGEAISANLILKGGLVRWANNGTSETTETMSVGGSISNAADSYFIIGTAANALTATMEIGSSISGSSSLFFISGSPTGTPSSGKTFRISGPVTNFFGTFVLGNGDLNAVNEILEFGYDVNSPGSLNLMGGNNALKLHQNCAFTSVIINGTTLSAGTHSYEELAAAFPGNFLPGGSGTITVQPFGPLATPPSIQIQPAPASQALFAGRAVQFTAGASAAGTNLVNIQWLKDGVAQGVATNGPGGATNTLTFNSITAGDAGAYALKAWNSFGSVTSSVATLGVVSPSEPYAAAVIAKNPAAFYQMNETLDPSVGGVAAFDNWNSLNGTYGNAAQNGAYGIAGPRPSDGFSGFDSDNLAANLPGNPGVQSWISAPAWNLTNNQVTLLAWINPSWAFENQALLLSRANGTTAGLLFTTNNARLGYVWNGDGLTSSWDSGITPPLYQWSLVALVVSPTNATIYVMNTSGLISASHVYPHTVQTFAGATLFGADPNDAAGNFLYQGQMDDVAVFNKALTRAEVLALYQAAAGQANYEPQVGALSSRTVYEGQKVTMTVAGDGNEPPTYRWQAGAVGSGIYTDLSDGGQFFGTKTPSLTLANVSQANALDYIVVLSNSSGSVTSSVATLTVMTAGPAQNITLSTQDAFGEDWDTLARWSDGQAASVSAAQNAANTYTILPGGRLRTPSAQSYPVFPGSVLTNSGNGIWVSPSGSAIGELGFKALTPGGVTFQKLVLNGGQINNAGGVNGNGVAQFFGEIEVLANSPFYNDSGSERGYQINSWLTGNGSIEYHGYNQTAFQTNYSLNLNIAGSSNTFSGTWNVVIGTLLGSGTNSLGTNTITVAAQGALETAYDINNANSDLILNGRMFLHQNDSFRNVFVDGTALNAGTYSFADLNAAYPANFPASWTPQAGSAVSTGSGSITVLLQASPKLTQQPQSVSVYSGQSAGFTASALGSLPLGYQWQKDGAALSDTAVRTGSATATLTIAEVAAQDAGDYTLVVTNLSGSVTSSVATLTVLTTGAPLNLTLDFGGAPIVQPAGTDWNNSNSWSDGNPASLSAVSNPGSTYEVGVGARLRSPGAPSYSAFPGNSLTISGSGVFENSTLNSVGELRLKHALVGTNYFKKLIMNGGQINNSGALANDTSADVSIMQGEIDILTATPIYIESTAVNCRSIQIDSWLTGTGSILWHDWNGLLAGTNLRITGTSNTFSGQWIVDQGALLGAGLNSLGTNDLIVGTNGLSAALETLYDVNNPNGSLVVGANGKMYLHQNDLFNSVSINGTPLADGTYTFEQLNADYPNAFPASWTPLTGSTASTASGSITVGAITSPTTNATISKVSLTGGSLVIHGVNNNVPNTAFHYVVLTSTNVALALDRWTPVATNSFNPDGTFDCTNTIEPGTPRQFLNVKIVP